MVERIVKERIVKERIVKERIVKEVLSDWKNFLECLAYCLSTEAKQTIIID